MNPLWLASPFFKNIKLIADRHGECAHPFSLLGCNCCGVSALLLLISDSGELVLLPAAAARDALRSRRRLAQSALLLGCTNMRWHKNCKETNKTNIIISHVLSSCSNEQNDHQTRKNPSQAARQQAVGAALDSTHQAVFVWIRVETRNAAFRQMFRRGDESFWKALDNDDPMYGPCISFFGSLFCLLQFSSPQLLLSSDGKNCGGVKRFNRTLF